MIMNKRIASEADILGLVKADESMMRALRIARDLDLPNWWIGAGFLRNKVWDAIAGIASSPARDVDLVYFDGSSVNAETDWAYDEQLKQLDPHNEWEVRNQARMHYKNDSDPFTSTEDGIAHWTETATAIGVKLEGEELRLLFCYGTDDLFAMIARPTPYFQGVKSKVFTDRMAKKNWQQRWPMLRIEK